MPEKTLAGVVGHLERIRDLDEHTSDGALGSLARRALDEIAALDQPGVERGELEVRMLRDDIERGRLEAELPILLGDPGRFVLRKSSEEPTCEWQARAILHWLDCGGNAKAIRETRGSDA